MCLNDQEIEPAYLILASYQEKIEINIKCAKTLGYSLGKLIISLDTLEGNFLIVDFRMVWMRPLYKLVQFLLASFTRLWIHLH